MSDSAKERKELKKYLKQLAEIRGTGTELISLYIPPKYPIGEIMSKLTTEYSQASNIKSKTTRSNVQDALAKIIHFMKSLQRIPENGIAIFAGNISQRPGESDIRLFYVIPPDPINVQLYRCDSAFFLEPLLVFTKPKEVYGLLAIDGKEATIGILEGKNLRVIKKIEALVPSKTHKGGQSARRYQRLVEEAKEEYYKRVGEAIDRAFLDLDKFKGLVVGGPGPVKEYFLNGKYFNYQIKVLGVVDTGYADEYGLQEIMQKVGDILREQEAVREKELVNRFISQVVKGSSQVAYGFKDVYEALQEGRVDTLLLSEDLYLHRVRFECPRCGKRGEKIIHSKDQKIVCDCGGEPNILEDEDLIPVLEDLAEKMGSKIEYVSTETTEGAQFLQGFYGLGALLRY